MRTTLMTPSADWIALIVILGARDNRKLSDETAPLISLSTPFKSGGWTARKIRGVRAASKRHQTLISIAIPLRMHTIVEVSSGRDFPSDPAEVPSLRALMPGKVKFVIGLENDEIGYIIPKSEWDEIAPYL